MKRTKIEDLPVPEKELTDSESKKIQGGFKPLTGGGKGTKTTTGLADDLTQPPGTNTADEHDQNPD